MKLSFKSVIYGLVAASLILFFTISNIGRAALYITAFIVLNMILSNYKRFIQLPVEIEFLTLGIVVCTLRFGLKAGLVVAILGGILSFIVGFNVSPFSFPMLTGYISMAFVSFFMRSASLQAAGVASVLVNNAIVFSMYHFVFRYDFFKNISYSLSNILFNVVLFFNIAPFL